MLSLQLIPLFILRARYADSLALAVEAAAITMAAVKERSSGKSPMQMTFDVISIPGAKPNEAWNQAEIHAITFGLLPATCELATERLQSPDLACHHALDVISACRQLGQTGSHSALWDRAADIIDKAFVVGASSQALMSLSGQLEQDVYGWLRAVGYVCAMSQPEANLVIACRIQVHIMSVAHANIRRLSRMTYDRVLVPWMTEYWLKRFTKQRFRFSSPAAVEDDLQAAMKQDASLRAQAVLQVVARGLDVRMDQQAREWIQAALTSS